MRFHLVHIQKYVDRKYENNRYLNKRNEFPFYILDHIRERDVECVSADLFGVVQFCGLRLRVEGRRHWEVRLRSYDYI